MIDFGVLGHVALTWEFLAALLSIVLIDLVLAGDNAVVIAMAVKNLHGNERRMGIVLGAGGAVLMRVICTILVVQLFAMSFVKLIAGAAILWIAIKLLTEGATEKHRQSECSSLWKALWIIIVADLSMGIDNMLAVGAASQGNTILLLFGLALSIPLTVFMSSFFTTLIDRYPIVLWAGAAVLGKVGGEMMITDLWVQKLWNPPAWVGYSVMVLSVVLIFAVSRQIIKRKRERSDGSPKTHKN